MSLRSVATIAVVALTLAGCRSGDGGTHARNVERNIEHAIKACGKAGVAQFDMDDNDFDFTCGRASRA